MVTVNTENVSRAAAVLEAAFMNALEDTKDGIAVATAVGALYCRCFEAMVRSGWGAEYIHATVDTLWESLEGGVADGHKN